MSTGLYASAASCLGSKLSASLVPGGQHVGSLRANTNKEALKCVCATQQVMQLGLNFSRTALRDALPFPGLREDPVSDGTPGREETFLLCVCHR